MLGKNFVNIVLDKPFQHARLVTFFIFMASGPAQGFELYSEAQASKSLFNLEKSTVWFANNRYKLHCNSQEGSNLLYQRLPFALDSQRLG